MTKEELRNSIIEIAKLTGQFKLRSGLTSEVYFDKYRFESQPQILKNIAKQMAPLVPEETEILAGLEMGGIPIATALALETGLPVAFIRKEAKEYGTCKFAEGCEIAGKKLCIIEDVITTGGQVVLSTQDLRSEGAIVNHVLSVIYRGQGDPTRLTDINLSFDHLFDFSSLV